jgi:hypothetical protein
VLVQKAEDDAYRDADVVVSMLPKVHELHGQRAGWTCASCTSCPTASRWTNGRATPAPLRDDVAQALAVPRRAGAHGGGLCRLDGPAQCAGHLLDAAKRCCKDAPIASFVMVGDGHERAPGWQRVAAEGLANVRCCRRSPRRRSQLAGAIDIAYIGWQRVPIYRFGIAPNKLMDYMMAGCVVLHSVEAGNDPVAEAAAA